MQHPYWKAHAKEVPHVLVSFSSPWFVSKTKHVHVDKGAPFVVTRGFLDEIMEQEAEAFTKELSAGNVDIQGSRVQIIEKAVVHSTINGYIVEDIIGKQTAVLDAYLSMSALSRVVLDTIAEVIFKKTHIPRDSMIFHSFPVVAFSVIRDMFPIDDDFLMMDITGESSDLTLAKDGVLQSTVSFPSGRNFLVRQVAKAFGVAPEIAESTLHLCLSHMADDETIRRMDVLMSDIEKEWSIYLEDALEELGRAGELPQNLYLTVDTDVADLYMRFLKMQKTDSTADFRKTLSVVHMKPDFFLTMVKPDPLMNQDEFICFLSAFYAKLIRR